MARRHQPRALDLLHRFDRKLGAWRVPRNHDHQNRFLVLRPLGHILETTYHSWRERDQVKRLEIHMFELALVVEPARTPCPGHGDEGLVGVVVVQHWTVTRLCATIGEIEAFRDLDRRHAGGIETYGRLLPGALDLRRLEADDVVEGALAAGHLAVGQTPIGALQPPEAGDALQHFLARYASARQSFPVFHRLLLIGPSLSLSIIRQGQYCKMPVLLLVQRAVKNANARSGSGARRGAPTRASWCE